MDGVLKSKSFYGRWKKEAMGPWIATIYAFPVPGTTRTTRKTVRPKFRPGHWLGRLSIAPPQAHDWLQARNIRRVHGRILLIGSRYDCQGRWLPVVLISTLTSQSAAR